MDRYAYAAPGDFYGDGYIDYLVSSDYLNSQYIYYGNGNNSFNSGVFYPTAESYTRGVAAGDFDKDGKMDWVSLGSGLAASGLGIHLSRGCLQ